MDRFYWMNVFVAVAETESFAKAGRRLGLSPPAVTRAISALEEKLGVRLLTRTTRVVRLTEAGARYLDDSRRIMAELDEADESAAGISATPRGQLHVTTSALFGKMFVTPIILEYLDRYPAVNVNAVFLDRVVNLVEEGIDIAIRIGELPDSALRASRVGTVRKVVVAAPSYLQQHGIPLHPNDLKSHRIVAAMGVTPSPEWRFYTNGKPLSVRVAPRITVNTNDGAIEAVRGGWGLTELLSYQVAPHLKSGELKTVLNEFEPSALPVHVVHLDGRRPTAKVRAFVDLVVERLRADSALN
jgi:DNA-binding transcriptional LysR family regulator